MDKLKQRIAFFRDAGNVQRFHTSRMINRQDIAQHTWNAITLAHLLEPSCRRELLLALHYHDTPEVITGDIPAPIKWSPESGVSEVIQELEQRVMEEHNIPQFKLTEAEQSLLRLCDTGELILHCLEEHQQGNRYALGMARRGLNFLLELQKYKTMPLLWFDFISLLKQEVMSYERSE